MERLIRYFVERHLLVNVLVVIVVALGLLQASRAKLETFPNVTLPTLFVNAFLPGASARDVETKVAIPIQDAVEELNGVNNFNALVSDNSVLMVVELDDEISVERLREAQRDLKVLIDGERGFPAEMDDDPVISRLNPTLIPVMEVALGGPQDLVAESALRLERRLRAMPSVSAVDLVGLPDPEARILVDPNRARAHGVTLLDIVRAIQRRNVSSTGGTLESASDRHQVVLWSRFETPAEVAQTVLRFEPDGGVLRVDDVARIELGREDVKLLSHTNGRTGVSLTITKQENADIVETADLVRAEVERTVLPEGVEIVIVRDESYMTRNRLDLMFNNGVIGMFLVVAVLFFFLTPGSAAWTLAGLPVVVLGTLALFPVLGFSINMITLTGLVVVLGMVVDDAIVVSERIVTRRQRGESRIQASTRGAAEMARPVTASAITTMLAFMPLWGLGGLPGKMIETMPMVIVVALAVSVMESFTILPAHLSMGSSTRVPPKRRAVQWMEERYRALLQRSLRVRGRLVAGFAAVLFTVFFVIAPNMPVVLFPQDDSESLFIKISLPLGTPLEQTEAVTSAIEQQLPTLMGDDVTAVVARIGHQDTNARLTPGGPGRGTTENEALVTARIRQQNRNHTSAEWAQILRRELQSPPRARLLFEPEYMGPPVGRPVTIHVGSNDDEERRQTASEIAHWVASIDGVTNVEIDERPGTPQIELVLDYARLALRGLDPQDVAQTLQIAFHGLVASEHRELEESTDFRVLLDPSARVSLDALLDLPVRSASGGLVMLRDVVSPVEVPAIARIYHRNGRRTATVSAQFSPDSPHTPISFAELTERELFPRYAGRDTLHVVNGGEATETRKAQGSVGIAALMAFGGITLVIAVMLGSFLEAAFVVAIIPFAVAGVMLAFFLHGMPLSMFAMMGAIGLSGVVVNASIVMVDAVHRRLEELPEDDEEGREAALVDAVVGRLRPIVVTTLTTLGGVMPMAYGIGGYDAMVAPMSLAIGWGLALSTAVTLFLVPTLYTLARDIKRRFGAGRRRKPRAVPEAHSTAA